MIANYEEQNYLVPLEHTIIKCCPCYETYWKDLRKSNQSFFKFDYSIEKRKSFRKFYCDERTLFHFCVECFKKVIFSIQFLIVQPREYFLEGVFNKYLVSDSSCIAGILRGKFDVESTCNGCVNFIIARFKAGNIKIV